MSNLDDLMARRGMHVVSVQEINPQVTPFYRTLIQARAQVHIAPLGINNPHNPKPYTTIRLELAEARGWVEVAATAHPKHTLEFAVIVAVIQAAEYTDSSYWLMRFADIATVLLDTLIKKLHKETRAAA